MANPANPANPNKKFELYYSIEYYSNFKLRKKYFGLVWEGFAGFAGFAVHIANPANPNKKFELY